MHSFSWTRNCSNEGSTNHWEQNHWQSTLMFQWFKHWCSQDLENIRRRGSCLSYLEWQVGRSLLNWWRIILTKGFMLTSSHSIFLPVLISSIVLLLGGINRLQCSWRDFVVALVRPGCRASDRLFFSKFLFDLHWQTLPFLFGELWICNQCARLP